MLYSHLRFFTGTVALLLDNEFLVCEVATGRVGLVVTELGDALLAVVPGVALVAG